MKCGRVPRREGDAARQCVVGDVRGADVDLAGVTGAPHVRVAKLVSVTVQTWEHGAAGYWPRGSMGGSIRRALARRARSPMATWSASARSPGRQTCAQLVQPALNAPDRAQSTALDTADPRISMQVARAIVKAACSDTPKARERALHHRSCAKAQHATNTRDETRTRTLVAQRGILSPLRLPIPPPGQDLLHRQLTACRSRPESACDRRTSALQT